MAYTKQTYTSRQVLTAANMNHIESGIYDAHTIAEGKQEELVSGETIKTVFSQSLLGSGDVTPSLKTINGESLLGEGDIAISGEGNSITVDDALSSSSLNPVQNKVIKEELDKKQEELISGTNIKTINSLSVIGEGNIDIGLASQVKKALLDCFANVAWINSDGQLYYKALETALEMSGGSTDTGGGTPETGVSNETIWTNGVAYTLNIIDNEYVKNSNGAFIRYDGWSRTDYVNCDGCSTIYFPPLPEEDSSSAISTAFYDSEKNRLSYFALNISDYTTVTVPENACYFAISSTTDALISCINNGIIPRA